MWIMILAIGATMTRAGAAEPQSEADRSLQIAVASVDVSDDADLDRVVASVGDARVVMIGEPWHGDGGAIATRGALIERLHGAGFDVLAFEADFFAVHLVWHDVVKGADARTAFTKAIFPFWAGAPVTDPLWSYVESAARSDRPLRIAGLDTQVTGQRSLDDLATVMGDAIQSLDGVAPVDVAQVRRSIPLVQTRLLNTLPQTSRAHLVALLRRVERESGDSFLRQTAKTMLRTLMDGRRDPGMSDNLVWLAETLYPGSRIIVVAHNNHILGDRDVFLRSPDPQVADYVRQLSPEQLASVSYLGAEARRHFGDRLFTIATLSNHGRYSTRIRDALSSGDVGHSVDLAESAALQPAGPDTLEAAFSRRAGDRRYVSLRGLSINGPVRSRVLHYVDVPAQSFNLHQGYDGVLFIRRTYPLTGP